MARRRHQARQGQPQGNHMTKHRIVYSNDNDWVIQKRYLGFLWLPMWKLVGYDTYHVVRFSRWHEAKSHLDKLSR